LVLASVGRGGEALREARLATEFDPLSSVAWLILGIQASAGARPDLADQAYQRARAIDPDNAFAAGFASQLHLLQGRPAQALEEARRSKGLEQMRLGAMAAAHHALGQLDEAEAALKSLVGTYAASGAWEVAQVYALRGDKDRAFEWLERARDQLDTGVSQVAYDPIIQRLRPDPRHAALLGSMNLSPEPEAPPSAT
jgi:serine/threonine-protein kinase